MGTTGRRQQTAARARDARGTALLLDQHPLWLDALAALLTDAGLEVVAKATDPSDALDLLAEHEPDLFVTSLEVAGSGMDGVEFLRRASDRFPGTCGIVLSMYDDPFYVGVAASAGADAYVMKTAVPEEIASAIAEAFAETRSGRRRRKPAIETPAPRPELTPREIEILQFVARGHTNAEIARRLWVTQWTVKFHLANAYRKLGVSNRTQAARYVFSHGLASGGSELDQSA